MEERRWKPGSDREWNGEGEEGKKVGVRLGERCWAGKEGGQRRERSEETRGE